MGNQCCTKDRESHSTESIYRNDTVVEVKVPPSILFRKLTSYRVCPLKGPRFARNFEDFRLSTRKVTIFLPLSDVFHPRASKIDPEIEVGRRYLPVGRGWDVGLSFGTKDNSHTNLPVKCICIQN